MREEQHAQQPVLLRGVSYIVGAKRDQVFTLQPAWTCGWARPSCLQGAGAPACLAELSDDKALSLYQDAFEAVAASLPNEQGAAQVLDASIRVGGQATQLLDHSTRGCWYAVGHLSLPSFWPSVCRSGWAAGYLSCWWMPLPQS
jgi:hypothetical protein